MAFEPSGISVTTADIWSFAFRDNDDNVLVSVSVPVTRLKELVDGMSEFSINAPGSANPGRGVAIPLYDLLGITHE